jgi:hypothetical protein
MLLDLTLTCLLVELLLFDELVTFEEVRSYFFLIS